MSPERLTDPEAIRVIDQGIETLKTAVEDYHKVASIDALTERAKDVWANLNGNPALQATINEDIKQERLKQHLLFNLSMANGDPVMARYNPNMWWEKMPTFMRDREGDYILDRSNFLISFLEALKSKE